jgi:hypothetical protein
MQIAIDALEVIVVTFGYLFGFVKRPKMKYKIGLIEVVELGFSSSKCLISKYF